MESDASASDTGWLNQEQEASPGSDWFEAGRRNRSTNIRKRQQNKNEKGDFIGTDDDCTKRTDNSKTKKSRTEENNGIVIPLQGMLVKRGTYATNLPKNLTGIADKKEENKENENHKESDSEQINATGKEINATEGEKMNTTNEVNDRRFDSARYTNRHRGDFCVLVDTSKSTQIDNEKMRNGLFLWEKIRGYEIEGIKNIKAIGRSLYKMYFENFEAANKCVDNQELIKNQLRPFIPKSLVETTGVARQIPLNFTDEEIRNNIRSDIPITAISRITRRDPNDKEKFIPTYSVKIAFEGNELPEEIEIFYVKIKIVHYIPRIRHCYNCGKLGHTKMGCKAANRCIICGKAEGCNSACKETTKSCILCGGENHISLESNKCSKWAKEKQVVEIMTIKKISKSEAIGIYNLNNNNRFAALEHYEGSFPQLETRKTPRINNDEVVNRKITTIKYSQVLKNNLPQAISPTKRSENVQRPKEKIQPVYEKPNWTKVTEIERLINLLIQRYDIDINDPVVHLIQNIGKVDIESNISINKDDRNNKNTTI